MASPVARRYIPAWTATPAGVAREEVGHLVKVWLDGDPELGREVDAWLDANPLPPKLCRLRPNEETDAARRRHETFARGMRGLTDATVPNDWLDSFAAKLDEWAGLRKAT